ncbi:WD40-repeat-containing domain protein [Blastocladiella britannica]|nr:WD40-repeat-containing domain protein [Blastocladiella britannica]
MNTGTTAGDYYGTGAARATESAGHTDYIAQFRSDAFTFEAYQTSYAKLRQWIDESLDVFKTELKDILFPIFEHVYLDLVARNMSAEAKQFLDSYAVDHAAFHADDLHKLAAVTDPHYLQQNEYAAHHRSSKFTVPMAATTFQLLIMYLEENKCTALLRILNQYIHIDVSGGAASKRARARGAATAATGTGDANDDDDDELAPPVGYGVLGINESSHATFNASRIALGMPPLDPKLRTDVEDSLRREDLMRAAGVIPDDELAGLSVSLLDLFRKHRPAEEHGAPESRMKVPMPPPDLNELQRHMAQMRDIAASAVLTATALPSTCFYTWHNTYDSLTCSALSDDATLAAAGFADSTVRLHSLTSAPLRARIAPPPGIDNAHLQAMPDDQLEAFYEPVGAPMRRLIGHSGTVFGVSIAPGPRPRWMMSGSEDGTARLWSLETYSNVAVYRGHGFPVWDVDVGPEGIYFATASHDRTARLWAAEQIHPLRIFAGHHSDVDAVKFHPNSNYLATGSSDKSARLWDVSSGNCVRVLTGHAGAVQTLAFSPNGRYLATAGDDKCVHVWDLGEGKRIKKMAGHRGLVTSLAFSQGNGALLVSGGLDGTVRVWDMLRSDDDTAGSGGADGSAAAAEVVSVKKKKKSKATSNDLLETFHTKNTPVTTLKFTQRNLLLASGPYSRDA